VGRAAVAEQRARIVQIVVEHAIDSLPPAAWRISPIVVRIRQVLPASAAKNTHFSHPKLKFVAIVEAKDGMMLVKRCRNHALPTKHTTTLKATLQNVKMAHVVEHGRISVFGPTADANDATAESRS
jgi:hypothetical protein